MSRSAIQFQLAHQLTKKLFKPGWLAEPKFDGLRMAIIVDEKNHAIAVSKTGLEVPSAKYICKGIERAKVFRKHVLDVEAWYKDWNTTASIVKTVKAPHKLAKELEVRAFDLIPLDEWKKKKCKLPLEKRRRLLGRLLTRGERTGGKYFSKVYWVQGIPVESYEQLMKLMKIFCKQGYEGVMLKDPKEKYQFKRSRGWLKVKPKYSGDLTVVDAVPGQGKRKGMLGSVRLKGKVDWKGKMVKIDTWCGGGFDDAELTMLWKLHKKKQLIGKVLEMEFETITSNNAMRFPQFLRIRVDKK